MIGGDFVYRYKYYSFGENSKKVLTHFEVYFSDPRKFNDPFDCLPSVVVGRLSKDSSVYQRASDQLLLDGLTLSKRRQKLNNAMNRLEVLAEDGTFLNRLLDGASVFCVSRVYDDILMWSHYAANHTGFVVEFKIPAVVTPHDFSDASNLIPLKVHYSPDRPELRMLEGASLTGGHIVKTLFTTKSNHWAYEQEERVIKRKGGSGPHNFKPGLISSVICGARMSDEDKAELEKIVENLSASNGEKAKIYSTSLHPKKYQVEVHGFPKRADAKFRF